MQRLTLKTVFTTPLEGKMRPTRRQAIAGRCVGVALHALAVFVLFRFHPSPAHNDPAFTTIHEHWFVELMLISLPFVVAQSFFGLALKRQQTPNENLSRR